MTSTQELYTSYQTILQKAADINNAAALLAWDQETYMPVKSGPFRGRQLATLAAQAHALQTDPAFGELLKRLAECTDLTDVQTHNVGLSLEDYEKQRKLPAVFVEELTQATSTAFNAWVKARTENDFSLFAGELDRMIGLKKQQASLYGYELHPYDALLDDYEKGMTVALLDKVFAAVKEQLPPLLARISAAPQVDDAFFNQHFPRQRQWDFSLEVLRAMGYDFDAGRQDYSEHPFTTSFAPTDVRVTTRVSESDLAPLLWSSIHEGGHALYEQGLPETQYGMPLGAAASLSIHESQSRLWENCVGRGAFFWEHFYPKLQEIFPEQLGRVSRDQFYRGANKVQPSLIRTEADELTYHFHVLIRYEIEKALMEGAVKTADLPALWNEQYRKYLGVTPPDSLSGVLQDVHWSHGSFGYFPTYSLGSMYGAQFYRQAQVEIAGLEAALRAGDFAPLLRWLREKVHQYGRRYRSEELCEKITGRGLDIAVFLDYLEKKYSSIYELKHETRPDHIRD